MPVDTLRISFEDRAAQNNSNARNAKIAIAAGMERFTAGCAKNCCTAGKEPETVVTAVPFSPSETAVIASPARAGLAKLACAVELKVSI
jgi:hypothetical protein